MCFFSETTSRNDSKFRTQADYDLSYKMFVAIFFERKKFGRAAARIKSAQSTRKNKAELRKSTTKVLKTINKCSSRRRMGSSATAPAEELWIIILEAEELVT